uniref:MADS-box domain-containing protein n=1 Tax=Syphacia muris TaxID=451379 RepID=A0A0N5AXA3_9BILA
MKEQNAQEIANFFIAAGGDAVAVVAAAGNQIFFFRQALEAVKYAVRIEQITLYENEKKEILNGRRRRYQPIDESGGICLNAAKVDSRIDLIDDNR